MGEINKQRRNLPIKTIWFEDGIYIIKTTKRNKRLLGKKIVAINSIPIGEITNKLSSIITVDNNATLQKTIPNLIPYTQLLTSLNIIDSSNIIFTLKNEYNATETHIVFKEPLTSNNKILVNLKQTPLYLQNERQLFWKTYIADKNTLYIQYNKCFSKEFPHPKYPKKELPSFKEFEESVFNILNSKPTEKLILDLRFNSGGNSIQGTEFIKKLSKHSINQKGKLYVIIGRKTYSSAILNTLDFKQYTEATIIGEETSGKPNHFGELKSFILPNSQIKIYYSTKFFKRLEKNMNTITPEIVIKNSFKDFINGNDSVLNYILNQ